MSSESKPSEDELFARLLEVLRPMAKHAMAGERRTATFYTSDLINEAAARVFKYSRAYVTAPRLKLLGGRAIHQVLVEQGRKKRNKKTIPAAFIDSLDQPVSGEETRDRAVQRGLQVNTDLDQVLWLEQILQKIEEEFGEEAVLIVVGKRYSDITDEELAQALGVSPRTIQRIRQDVRDFCLKKFGRGR